MTTETQAKAPGKGNIAKAAGKGKDMNIEDAADHEKRDEQAVKRKSNTNPRAFRCQPYGLAARKLSHSTRLVAQSLEAAQPLCMLVASSSSTRCITMSIIAVMSLVIFVTRLGCQLSFEAAQPLCMFVASPSSN